MSPDTLKKRVVQEFKSNGLLDSLDIESSSFAELPRFFEASHISMRLVLEDMGALAGASRIAAEIKRELDRQGVDLEYEIRTQWRVVSIGCDALERDEEADSCPPEHFHVEVESGVARRSMAIRVSPEAKACILRYLSHVPPTHRQSATYKLLETCINQKLSSRDNEYWNPILYPNRNIELQDIARIVESRVDSGERELTSSI